MILRPFVGEFKKVPFFVHNAFTKILHFSLQEKSVWRHPSLKLRIGSGVDTEHALGILPDELLELVKENIHIVLDLE